MRWSSFFFYTFMKKKQQQKKSISSFYFIFFFATTRSVSLTFPRREWRTTWTSRESCWLVVVDVVVVVVVVVVVLKIGAVFQGSAVSQRARDPRVREGRRHQVSFLLRSHFQLKKKQTIFPQKKVSSFQRGGSTAGVIKGVVRPQRSLAVLVSIFPSRRWVVGGGNQGGRTTPDPGKKKGGRRRPSDVGFGP